MVSFFMKGYRAELVRACDSIREELDDHLEAINENARDVADVREVIGSVEEKLEKLHGRIDELYLLLGADAHLSSQEQALVQFLQSARAVSDVAQFLGSSVASAEHAIRVLCLKGVAVHQFAQQGGLLVTTNPSVKDTVSLHNYL